MGGGGKSTPQGILACRPDINEIPTATPMFLGSSIPTKLVGMLLDRTGSEKSNMAAAKPEVLISKLTDQLGTRFQRQNLCFRGFTLQWYVSQCHNSTPEVGNPIWRPPNR
jgi:hypothetical protein